MRTGTKLTALGLAAVFAFSAEPALAIGDGITPLKANITPLKADITPMESEEKATGGEKIVTLSSDVLFDLGKWDISDAAQKKIGDVVKKVPKGATVKVGGHTDNLPYKEGNDVLSKRRADAVADAIKKNRSDLKTDVKGYGESKPVEPNEKAGKDNPEGRAKNRRVEIRYNG